jgi:hypothetical protein
VYPKAVYGVSQGEGEELHEQACGLGYSVGNIFIDKGV